MPRVPRCRVSGGSCPGVEDRPALPLLTEDADPVDDVTAQETGGAEHSVAEVAERSAEDEPERDRPAGRVGENDFG